MSVFVPNLTAVTQPSICMFAKNTIKVFPCNTWNMKIISGQVMSRISTMSLLNILVNKELKRRILSNPKRGRDLAGNPPGISLPPLILWIRKNLAQNLHFALSSLKSEMSIWNNLQCQHKSRHWEQKSLTSS